MVDHKLDGEASACTTAQIASFYAACDIMTGESHEEVILGLTERVALRQLSSGAFAQPYYVTKGEQGTIDIAEIGACITALYHSYRLTGSIAAKTT